MSYLHCNLSKRMQKMKSLIIVQPKNANNVIRYIKIKLEISHVKPTQKNFSESPMGIKPMLRPSRIPVGSIPVGFSFMLLCK